MASPEAPQWLEACMYEMEALKKTGTFEWIERPPPECQVVGSHWVFKVKWTSSGEIEKFCTQVVAKGYTKVPGIDFFETYAPTIQKQSFLIILTLAAEFNLELIHFNVKSAFLNPILKQLIYMELPPGFTPPKPGMVWVLC
jgi:Reverse transcriptase (RNA-dependent DNA polymerase)